jgi:hypothetical protein
MRTRSRKSIRTKYSTRLKKVFRVNTLLRMKPSTRLALAIGGGVMAIIVVGLSAAMLTDHEPEVSRAAPQMRSARMPGIPRETVSPVAPALDTPTGTTGSAVVTITGCLERDDEMFRLKDASGNGAPKSRSWKSGFLKKRSATVDVVDTAHRVRLPDYLGQRVSVTGPLVDREMQVRSLRRVAASCS